MSSVHAMIFFVQYGKNIPVKSKVLEPYLETAVERVCFKGRVGLKCVDLPGWCLPRGYLRH